MISISGWSASQRLSFAGSRSARRSITIRCSGSQIRVPWRCPFRHARSSTPMTRRNEDDTGTLRRTVLSSVSLLTGNNRRRAIACPGRPPKAKPKANQCDGQCRRAASCVDPKPLLRPPRAAQQKCDGDNLDRGIGNGVPPRKSEHVVHGQADQQDTFDIDCGAVKTAFRKAGTQQMPQSGSPSPRPGPLQMQFFQRAIQQARKLAPSSIMTSAALPLRDAALRIEQCIKIESEPLSNADCQLKKSII
jgi:hypothetical protein